MPALGIDIGGSSIKLALIDHHAPITIAASDHYNQPSPDQLTAHLARAATRLPIPPDITAIGICLPGIMAPDGIRIERSVNLPALQGTNLPDLIAHVTTSPAPRRIFTDAHAAAFGYWSEHPLPDRLFALSLGTGVGACVLDNGQQLLVTARSSGHFGQIDVGPCDDPQPIGPDGGHNSLEAYIGLPALHARYGSALAGHLTTLTAADPPLRALVRALRIAHAIYRPQHIALLGGLGLQLAPHRDAIKAAVDEHLTCIADPAWSLHTAESSHHAAIGAARLASA
ncbi:MAG: ROK family protein [Phycisphaeraceae bacterium]|nr:ROK family protein [Phycisphaeraceae bacterium]MCW5761948.1 ROK family protein [Phycisphaeraceae bacterium]